MLLWHLHIISLTLHQTQLQLLIVKKRLVYSSIIRIMKKDFEYYKNCFTSLNTMKRGGKVAPHKALLLLAVINLIEHGVIKDCRVPFSDELIKQFKHIKTIYLGESIPLFQPNPNCPFCHMSSEPFWQLVTHNGDNLTKVQSYSKSFIRNNIAYALIDNELFELLQDTNVRAQLRTKLISFYLNDQSSLADNLSTMLWILGSFVSLTA